MLYIIPIEMHADIILLKRNIIKNIWRVGFLNQVSVNPLKMITKLFSGKNRTTAFIRHKE